MKKQPFMNRAFAFFLCFILVLPNFAYGETTTRVAVIKEVNGDVKVKRAGGEKLFPAVKGAGLVQGDGIVTGKDSTALLIIDEDKEVKIAEGTQLKVSELVKAANDMGEQTSMSLLSGKVLITLNKKLTKDSKFEIKTPTAVMLSLIHI